MLESAFFIGNRRIAASESPYVIAEAGSNFNQSLDTALRLIDIAAEARADAVKFQLFRADILYPQGGKMHDIFKSVQLNADWLERLAAHAKERGLHFLASVFDHESLAALMRVDPPAHKVASSEVTNTPLLHAMASTGKPMLLSTGMCDMIDVETAVEICEAAGNRELALLQCGTVYPLPTEQANIRVLRTFADRFGAPVGFSDHTLSNTAVCAAVSLGAAVIEKHFTFDSKAEGPDHFYALEPAALKDFVAVVRETHAALGDGVKEMLPSEREHGRRDGLYVSRDLPAGHILTAEDIAVRRPALGLRSRHYDMVIGARLKKPLAEAAPLHWDVLAYGRE